MRRAVPVTKYCNTFDACIVHLQYVISKPLGDPGVIVRRLHTPIANHSAGSTTPAVCRTRIAGQSARPTPQSVDHRMPRPQVRARLYTGRPAEPRPQQAAVAPRRPAELCPNKATHAKALHIITIPTGVGLLSTRRTTTGKTTCQ